MAKRSNFFVEIPEDVMIEILLRLPVKSLLRFKSVCKLFYALTKSPNFIFMHHKFNLGRLSNLLMCTTPNFKQKKYINNHVFAIRPKDECASEDFGILANPDTYVKFVTGSCNGIVCYYDNTTIYLSNPATREFKQLPPTSFESHETDDKKLYRIGVAFGYGSTNIYDFKVCQIFVPVKKRGRIQYTHKAFKAEMFTLSSNSWKQLHWGLDDILNFSVISESGSFCANSFHFLAVRFESCAETIVCCDIHTERFRTMELPSPREGSFVSLMAHRDFLSAVCIPMVRRDTFVEVWIMKDYGVVASWTKLYSIRQHGRVPRFFWTEKDALVCTAEKSQLVLCHHDSLNCELLEIDGYNSYSQIIVYQPTLVSIM